ncbi:IS3 family transposase [Exiguobacterium antarcticum]|uniref:IS3 family transposase n=1 Tax=Exiguobacterium antarcticum TaxID=132920 RepID=UPI0012375981|nr:IS3 family transposase [Exiguobacterium antarcticum]
MTRTKHSVEQKLEALRMLASNKYTVQEVCKTHRVSRSTLERWKARLHSGGVASFEESSSLKIYTKELKQAAVRDYLEHGFTALEVLSKYQISSTSVFYGWIKKYTSHSELKDSRKEAVKAMTKGRQTTLEERIEIIEYCLQNGRNYKQTSVIFDVAYHQVYGWMKKYDVDGMEGLEDRRGRTKQEEELTEAERLTRRLQQMEREIERLRIENLFLKKLKGDREEELISQIRLQRRYVAIYELAIEEASSIVLLCEIAQVSRAAYYKWLKRTVSVRDRENQTLLEDIRVLYDQVRGIYGYRRITMTINRRRREDNLPVYNEKRIHRLMRIHDIKSIIRQKRKGHKKSTPQHTAENLMNRDFSASRRDEKWCTDITEFKYGVGKKAYLSAIIDLYDGSIVSYRIGKSNNSILVFQTLIPAITQLPPGAIPMIHSDRGNQYTSRGFKTMIEDANLTHSMSRVGRCLDNAPIESFWGTLKSEMYYLRDFQAYEELKSYIEAYIYFYNNERFQKRLNGLSPIEFRTKAA